MSTVPNPQTFTHSTKMPCNSDLKVAHFFLNTTKFLIQFLNMKIPNIDRPIQPQAAIIRTTTMLRQPTPTPSFAKFDRRADPTFSEWASRHIPLSSPADSNFKSIRSSEGASSRGVTSPFLDSSLRTTGSQRGAKSRPIPTPIPRPNFLETRDKEEFPGPSLAGKIPADKWFLLAKNPDFLNNIAWGAQLHINNKTGGSGYLRPKVPNRRPVEQELDYHPFQGFGSPNKNNKERPPKIQEPLRMERTRTSFKPSPLLSVTKEQDVNWTPFTTRPFISSPRPPFSVPPPQTRQQPPPPPPPPQPISYPATKPNYAPSSKPFKPFSHLSQATKSWTQPKKQMYQSTAGGMAYQVILTSGSDYEVHLTRGPQPTLPTLPAVSPSISSSASSPASSRTRLQLQPPKLISPSDLPLEPHPLTNQANRNFPKASSSNLSPTVVNNQQQRLASTQQFISSTVQPPEQKLFRSPEAEKITSQSVPMRPSVLLSSNVAVSTQSPFEFEPTSSRTADNSSSSRNTLRQTPRYVETDVIRGKSNPTSTTIGTLIINEDDHFRSFVVRPRNPTRVSEV